MHYLYEMAIFEPTSGTPSFAGVKKHKHIFRHPLFVLTWFCFDDTDDASDTDSPCSRLEPLTFPHWAPHCMEGGSRGLGTTDEQARD